jgi:hypothetical protein
MIFLMFEKTQKILPHFFAPKIAPQQIFFCWRYQIKGVKKLFLKIIFN